MRRAVVALVSIAVCAFTVCDTAAAESWLLPDGVDNARPRYYDYRAPRPYYYDDAPMALRVSPPAFIYAVPAPAYAPTGAYLPPPAYPPPAYGYVAPPAPPPPVVRARPICGVYRFWNGERCIDARGD